MHAPLLNMNNKNCPSPSPSPIKVTFAALNDSEPPLDDHLFAEEESHPQPPVQTGSKQSTDLLPIRTRSGSSFSGQGSPSTPKSVVKNTPTVLNGDIIPPTAKSVRRHSVYASNHPPGSPEDTRISNQAPLLIDQVQRARSELSQVHSEAQAALSVLQAVEEQRRVAEHAQILARNEMDQLQKRSLLVKRKQAELTSLLDALRSENDLMDSQVLQSAAFLNRNAALVQSNNNNNTGLQQPGGSSNISPTSSPLKHSSKSRGVGV